MIQTLDLTDRARLAINGLTGSFDENYRYEHYCFGWLATDSPWLVHYKSHIELTPKLLESLAYMRYMTGADEKIDVDRGVFQYVREDIGPKGLYYSRALPGRPWHEGGPYHPKGASGDDYAPILSNARLLLACLAWSQTNPDDAQSYRDMARGVAKGLTEIAICRDDIAYYPDGEVGVAYCYGAKTGWGNDTQEPDSDLWGGEGSVQCYYGQVLRALVRWYEVEPDEQTRDIIDRLARFCMLPKLWGTESEEHDSELIREQTAQQGGEQLVPGMPVHGINNDPHHLCCDTERGHFKGHFHGKLMGLRGLLEYARVFGDPKIARFVRDGYEFARHRGIPEMGCFGDHWWLGVMEGCTAADMLALALRLTEAGLGDYYDDAEKIIRNQLIEQQFTTAESLDLVKQAGKNPENPWSPFLESLEGYASADDMPDNAILRENISQRVIGMYANFSGPAAIPMPYITTCCTGNCTEALYYGWNSILTSSEEDGVMHARVHLWLDRRSPEIDVVSHVPFEGMLEIRNHLANKLSIRIPDWSSPSSCVVQVNGQEVISTVVGRYLHLSEIHPGDIVKVSTPLQTETFKSTMPFSGEYELTMRGHHVISITPGDTSPNNIPIYQRNNDGSVPRLTEQAEYTPANTTPRW